MSKKSGDQSFQTFTIEQLEKLLQGNKNIPIKVSKGWLKAIKEIFPTEGQGVEEEEEGSDNEDSGRPSSNISRLSFEEPDNAEMEGSKEEAFA